MLKIEKLSPKAVKITLPAKLSTGDFTQAGAALDELIGTQAQINVLINAAGFHGWEHVSAFEAHLGMVKSHQKKFGRLAIVTAHDWQQWIIAMARHFMHPEVKTFDDASAAETWLLAQ